MHVVTTSTGPIYTYIYIYEHIYTVCIFGIVPIATAIITHTLQTDPFPKDQVCYCVNLNRMKLSREKIKIADQDIEE